jgi:hypothetical protein
VRDEIEGTTTGRMNGDQRRRGGGRSEHDHSLATVRTMSVLEIFTALYAAAI